MRRLTWALVAMTLVAAGAVGLTALAWRSAREAELERSLGRQSLLRMESAPEESLLLAVAALRHHREGGGPAVGEAALRRILPQIWLPREIVGSRGARGLSYASEGDGRWLAALEADGSVVLHDTWGDAASRRLAGSDASALAFSPDGSLLAVGDGGGGVALRSPDEVSESARRRIDHGAPVAALAFRSDGRWLAVGGARSVRLYDLETSASVGPLEIADGEGAQLRALAFSADGRWLAAAPRSTVAGSSEWPVRLWDTGGLPAEPRLEQDLYQAGEAVSLAFGASQNGPALATAHRDGRVLVWLRDVQPSAAGDEVSWSGELLRQAWFPISTLAFDPSGRWLATASGAGGHPTVIWQIDPVTGAATANRIVLASADRISALAYGPDGSELATGALEGPTRTWDLAGQAAASVVLRNPATVEHVHFGPEGRWIATSGRGRAHLWDLQESADAPVESFGAEDRVRELVFSADGRRLAIGLRSGSVRMREISAAGVTDGPVRESPAGVWNLALSPDGRWLAVEGEDEVVRLWDLAVDSPEPREVGSGEAGTGPSPEAFPAALEFDPAGRFLVRVFSDGGIGLDRLPAPGPPATRPKGRAGGTREVTYAFSPGGELLATARVRGREYRLWRLGEGEARPPAVRVAPAGILALAFDASGSRLKLVSETGVDQVMVSAASVGSGHALSVASLGHAQALQDAVLSSDGRWLSTVSGGVTAKLLDLSSDGLGPGSTLLHRADVVEVAFSDDGRWLSTAGRDRVVRLWPLGLEELIELGCRAVGSPARVGLSRQEWERLFPADASDEQSPPLRYRSAYATLCE